MGGKVRFAGSYRPDDQAEAQGKEAPAEARLKQAQHQNRNGRRLNDHFAAGIAAFHDPLAEFDQGDNPERNAASRSSLIHRITKASL